MENIRQVTKTINNIYIYIYIYKRNIADCDTDKEYPKYNSVL